MKVVMTRRYAVIDNAGDENSIRSQGMRVPMSRDFSKTNSARCLRSPAAG